MKSRTATKVLGVMVAGIALSGCGTFPANPLVALQGEPNVMQEVMERKNKIVYLSSPAMARGKPVLLLLHGATDDPSEMLDIVKEWKGEYNVLLYSYNYHQHIKRVALGLVREMKTLRAKIERLKAEGGPVENVTVVTFSYSAIVFRKAVLAADDPTLFSDASLIQLVPTAGGSALARGMENPIAAFLVSLASKASVAENPYGSLAEELWEGDGNRKFYEAINPGRMYTILLEGDSHSLADVRNETIQRRYSNGIGTNIVVIPKTAGVTHDYFPTEPAARGYLRRIIQSLPDRSDRKGRQVADKNQTPPHDLSEFRSPREFPEAFRALNP